MSTVYYLIITCIFSVLRTYVHMLHREDNENPNSSSERCLYFVKGLEIDFHYFSSVIPISTQARASIFSWAFIETCKPEHFHFQ